MEEHGMHGTGTTAYTPQQYGAVVYYLRTYARERPVKVAELVCELKLTGNAVRAIVSAADGVDLVTGNNSKGYRVATTRAEVVTGTRALLSQIGTMKARAERRMNYAQNNLE